MPSTFRVHPNPTDAYLCEVLHERCTQASLVVRVQRTYPAPVRFAELTFDLGDPARPPKLSLPATPWGPDDEARMQNGVASAAAQIRDQALKP